MEEVIIAQVNLGETPPLIHRVSQPLLDERGTWIDADVTYEGLMHMTITTKLNLLRLKRQQTNVFNSGGSGVGAVNNLGGTPTLSSSPISTSNTIINEKSNDAIYDSNAESSGASSSDSESITINSTDNQFE